MKMNNSMRFKCSKTCLNRANAIRATMKLLQVLVLFSMIFGLCEAHGNHHGHDHDHDDYHHHHNHHDNFHQPASFKYSREANERLVQQNQHIHKSHEKVDGHSHTRHVHTSSDTSKIWITAIGSTVLISAAPFLILYLIPLDNTDEMRPRLKCLLAFASGGLLGDAFLHLIPHAISPHSHHDHDHSHGHSSHDHDDHGHSDHNMIIGLWVLLGIITFLGVEKSVRLIKGGHGHSHNHSQHKKTSNQINNHQTSKSNATNKLDNNEKDKKEKKKQNKKVAQEKTSESEVEIAGYLNLAADFTHNFTDGLAIGASYLAGNSIGILTTITILLHEVPHEIGDFAILVKSGCSKRKAMMLQLVTAVGALAGTSLALLGAENEVAATWILPFTAGGFIYIATVSVLPELLEESTKLGQSLKEILSLLAGVGLMVLISHLEE